MTKTQSLTITVSVNGLKIIFTNPEIFSTKYIDAEWVDIQRINTNQATYLYQFLQWVQTKKFWFVN